MTIEDRIRYASAKMRNIIYYRLTVEEQLVDSRYRCQFMHVLRNFRKQLVELVEDMDENDTRIQWFNGVIALLDPKLKSTECKDIIRRFRDYSNKLGYPQYYVSE